MGIPRKNGGGDWPLQEIPSPGSGVRLLRPQGGKLAPRALRWNCQNIQGGFVPAFLEEGRRQPVLVEYYLGGGRLLCVECGTKLIA